MYTNSPSDWGGLITLNECKIKQSQNKLQQLQWNLHPPTANLTKFRKAVYYSKIKIFKKLPHEIKDLTNDILPFRNALKRILLINSSYDSKEYFNYRRRSTEI